MKNSLNYIVHAGKYYGRLSDVHEMAPESEKKWHFLYLIQVDQHYCWHYLIESEFLPTALHASSVAKASVLARRQWDSLSFTTLNCGVKYALPERDEVGLPALFNEMRQSYEVSSGQYMDQSLGHPCRVEHASKEALSLLKQLA